jgi:hypothetical protein
MAQISLRNRVCFMSVACLALRGAWFIVVPGSVRGNTLKSLVVNIIHLPRKIQVLFKTGRLAGGRAKYRP